MIVAAVTWRWVTRVVAICLTLVAATWAYAQGAPGDVGAAINRDPVFESLRAACEAQYAHPRGEEARKAHAANVRRCTSTKMLDAAHAAIANPMAFNTPVPLLETKPWLVKPNRGPAQAKGVIYYLSGGFNPANRTIESYRIVPYYLKSLADDGWDVVRAKIPYDFPGYYNWLYLGGYIQTIQRRVAALHAEGYQHVILAGHSVGGWMSMMAARDGIAADALLLDAPNLFGSRTLPNTGRPNPDFLLSLTEFGAALGNDKVPAVLMLPEDAVFEPDAVARGQIAEAHFTQVKVPHLVIAKPPGFSGHFANFLPIFDYAYGACLRAFLDNPVTVTSCAPPKLVNTDFRSITSLTEVAGANTQRIVSVAPLIGRKFVAYTLQDVDNKHFEYVTHDERVTMLTRGVTIEHVTFRGGLQCVGQVCSVLVRWSDHEALEFDPESGAIKAWWIEDTSDM